MHSAENSGDLRCLTDVELDKVAGGHPAAIVGLGGLFILGLLIGDAWKPELNGQVPSWYNTMI
jgi:hypothetical protein